MDASYYRWCKEYGGLKLDQAKRLKELERSTETRRGRLVAGEGDAQRGDLGKLLNPKRRRQAVLTLQQRFAVSERRACQVAGHPCGMQRYTPALRSDEYALTRDIITLAGQYGRYGYRRITALLQDHGWFVGEDRVQRIWRREGLEVPKKQSRRGHLWLKDGSCVRLSPQYRDHVWSYDSVSARIHDGPTVPH